MKAHRPALELRLEPMHGPSPLYDQVKQLITRHIVTGTWLPNQQLPSENSLVDQLGVSRMTINRALRELTDAGILTRMQGVGTFVAEPTNRSSLLEVRNIADDIAERGHSHHLRILRLEAQPATADQATDLEVSVGARLYHSVMVHFEEEVAIQLEDRCVNPLWAPDYLEQDFTSQTANAYLSSVAPLTEVEHIVNAVLATEAERKLIDTAENEPCLLIHRRTWSGDDVVSSARLLHPGTRNRLEGRLKL